MIKINICKVQVKCPYAFLAKPNALSDKKREIQGGRETHTKSSVSLLLDPGRLCFAIFLWTVSLLCTRSKGTASVYKKYEEGGGRPDMSVPGWTAVYPLVYQLVKLAFCIEPGFSFPSGGQMRLCGLKDTRGGGGVVSKKNQQSHLATRINYQSLLRI